MLSVINGKLAEVQHCRVCGWLGDMRKDFIVLSPNSKQVFKKQGSVHILVGELNRSLGEVVYNAFYGEKETPETEDKNAEK